MNRINLNELTSVQALNADAMRAVLGGYGCPYDEGSNYGSSYDKDAGSYGSGGQGPVFFPVRRPKRSRRFRKTRS
jgi:hypothetical protein